MYIVDVYALPLGGRRRSILVGFGVHAAAVLPPRAPVKEKNTQHQFTGTKKQSPNTGASANNTLHK